MERESNVCIGKNIDYFINKVEVKIMDDLSNNYMETAAYFELIASQTENLQEQQNNIVQLPNKLESLWVKLQCLVEKESKTSYRRAALQEAQSTLKRLCSVKRETDNPQVPSEQKSEEDKARKSSIEDTILKSGNVKFDDIAGLAEAKMLLKEAIVLPLQYPHLFTGKRKPWRSILLYGPPGA